MNVNQKNLNQPFDCPTCLVPVRKLSGKLVLAAKSSPYDGEFDANIHKEHTGCSREKSPDLSDAELENANAELDRVNQGEK